MLGIGDQHRSRGLKRELEIEAKRQGISLDFSYEMQSVTAVLDLIERDIGFGILPFGAVRRRVEEGSLKSFRIADPEVCRKIRLVRSPRRLLSVADRAAFAPKRAASLHAFGYAACLRRSATMASAIL
jgi:DNA-binding transcriptional LysR family regulator